MWIHVNLWIINDVLTIKNVFTAIRVVWIIGESWQKTQIVRLRYFNPLISKHIKYLFSKLGFY